MYVFEHGSTSEVIRGHGAGVISVCEPPEGDAWGPLQEH